MKASAWIIGIALATGPGAQAADPSIEDVLKAGEQALRENLDPRVAELFPPLDVASAGRLAVTSESTPPAPPVVTVDRTGTDSTGTIGASESDPPAVPSPITVTATGSVPVTSESTPPAPPRPVVTVDRTGTASDSTGTIGASESDPPTAPRDSDPAADEEDEADIGGTYESVFEWATRVGGPPVFTHLDAEYTPLDSSSSTLDGTSESTPHSMQNAAVVAKLGTAYVSTGTVYHRIDGGSVPGTVYESEYNGTAAVMWQMVSHYYYCFMLLLF